MTPTLTAYAALAGAILFELVATSFMARSRQFTQLAPTLAAALFYAASFYCLAQSLRTLPLGVAYGIWAGMGIVLTAALGVVMFRQTLDAAALIGLGFIVIGVVTVNGFSKSVLH
jgi:small multidrug resistance pump